MDISAAVAVISGGASGLGNAVARRVVAAGGSAVMVDVNRDLGEQAASELGDRAHFVAADVTSESDIDQLFATAVERFGGVNLVVSCAGVIGSGLTLGRKGPMALEKFARVININLVGTFNMARAGINVMQHNEPDSSGERGVVVNTASVAAFEGQIGQAAYSASKGGVVGLTLPLAREFSRYGVRVMAIAPGLFMTPMLESLPDEAKQALAASVPFPKRLGNPDEYAELVASIYGNSMLNGEVIRLDGAIRMEPQ
ncbi:MAG TPA: 3-hydroxyacyl-CoA dehydrogenase [Gammaproteobacteria bacterium]|nr:3-hydroxyacyl-CoA dehydrogenase [Gammaproteobacteria bacterium]